MISLTSSVFKSVLLSISATMSDSSLGDGMANAKAIKKQTRKICGSGLEKLSEEVRFFDYFFILKRNLINLF